MTTHTAEMNIQAVGTLKDKLGEAYFHLTGGGSSSIAENLVAGEGNGTVGEDTIIVDDWRKVVSCAYSYERTTPTLQLFMECDISLFSAPEFGTVSDTVAGVCELAWTPWFGMAGQNVSDYLAVGTCELQDAEATAVDGELTLDAVAIPDEIIEDVCDPCDPVGDIQDLVNDPPDGGELLNGPRPETGRADCYQCRARNTMTWRDHHFWESVRVKESRNFASEIIDAQDLHAALISSSYNECYNGSQRWTDSEVRYGQQNSPNLSSGNYTAVNDKWTLASGHHWRDQGRDYGVGKGNDICKQF